jgi:hypothetical protein
MDQSVMSFAGTAARGSAIATPVEGMVTYLEDSDLLSIYETGAWRTSVSPRGGVLQVVFASNSTQAVSTSTSYSDTGLTGTITPKSASSRILVFITQNGVQKAPGGAEAGVRLRVVFPNATTQVIGTAYGFTDTSSFNFQSVATLVEYSSGNTSAQTFKTQFGQRAGSSEAVVQAGNIASSMILMEVAN